MIPERYIHNLSVYGEVDIAKIRKTTITVVGAGGLGGYVIDQFTRLGVGTLRIIDCDSFDVSNLNRQLYSNTDNIGRSKAEVAAQRVALVNPEVRVETFPELLSAMNASELLKGSDLVIDAVDNLNTKMLIQDCCRELGIPFVHAAVGGWSAQVCLVMPGQDTLDSIYNRDEPESYPVTSVPPFTPAVTASIQVAEGLKFILGQHDSENRTLIYLELQSGELIKVNMGSKNEL
jgi:molybdopterin/thiamine biosynthesis adenylyltransferase